MAQSRVEIVMNPASKGIGGEKQAWRMLHEFEAYRSWDYTGLEGTIEQDANSIAAALAIVQGEVIDIHAHKAVGE
jgi:hypothetical protein